MHGVIILYAKITEAVSVRELIDQKISVFFRIYRTKTFQNKTSLDAKPINKEHALKNLEICGSVGVYLPSTMIDDSKQS